MNLEQQGDLLGAAKYYELYLEKTKNEITEKVYSDILGNVATLYWRSNDLDKALEIYEQVKNIRKRIGNEAGYALALLNMGEINGCKQFYKKALNYILQGLRLTLEKGNTPQKIIGYKQLIEILKRTGQIRQAIKSELLLLEIISQQEDYESFFKELLKLTEQAHLINAFTLAEDMLQEAEELLKKLKIPSYSNKISLERIKLEKEKKNFEIAEKNCEKLIEHAKNLKDYSTVEEGLFLLAQILDEKGLFPIAMLKIHECDDMAKKTGNIQLAALCKKYIEKLFFETFIQKRKIGPEGKEIKMETNIKSKIKKNNGWMILDTRFTEVIPLFASIQSFHLSYNNKIALFSPIDYKTIAWDISNNRVILDYNQTWPLISSLATFAPGSTDIIVAFNQKNLLEDENRIILYKAYILQTIDHDYKLVNEAVFELSCEDPSTILAFFSGNAERLFTYSRNLGLEARDTDSGEKIQIPIAKEFIPASRITCDYQGNKIFCLRSSLIEIWDLDSAQILYEFKPHVVPFENCCVDTNLDHISYERKDGVHEIWNILENKKIASFEIDKSILDKEDVMQHHKFLKNNRSVFDNKGELYAFQGKDGKIHVGNVKENKILKSFSCPVKSLSVMNFSPDSTKLLISSFRDKSYIIELKEKNLMI
ncbi:MAG: hypothetical protein ACTSVV_11930 [Promethearchaeota archaeon]